MSTARFRESERSRLATRTSFFGGPVSTREAARAPGWQAVSAPPPRPQSSARREIGNAPGPAPVQAGAVEPDHQPKTSIKASLDFSGLGLAPKAPGRPTASQSKPGVHTERAGPGSKLGAGQIRATAGARSVQARGPAADPGTGLRATSLSPPPSKRVITHATVTSTKGRRKGEGGRTTAVNVAAVGKDRKQMADAALRARVDAAKASLPPVSLPSHSFRPAPASQRASMAHIGVTSATGRGTLHIVRPAPGTKGPSPAVSPPDRRGALPSGVTSRAGQPLNRLGGDSSCRPDLRGTFYGGKQPPTALQRKRRLSLEAQDSDASDFINDEGDGEMGGAEGDWRSALRSALGGYDPGRFAEVDRMDDRSMEVTRYSDIAAEEQRSLRIAREADRREAEAEAARLAAKEEVKRRRRGAAAFLDDD
uniref:Uncharacterized protein n=1 Tax=Auxenochlorella protothecoides TaxID=3075 RepID=A0A1D2A8C1_AUXPR